MKSWRYAESHTIRLLLSSALSCALIQQTIAADAEDKTPPPAANTPQRLVSLAPHTTEYVYFLGAGNRLVGAVEYSDYPEEAKQVPRVGGYQTISLEKIASLSPDLVLLWTSGQPALAKSAQWSGPWSTGAGGPRGKGGHSDPTATVALAACPDDKGRVRDQPEHRYHQRLVTAISFTADNAVDITTVINAINSHGDEPRTDTECAEHHCNASASTGPTNRPNRRGRCDACYQWLHHWLTAHPGSTWADAPAVPAEVINARSIRRQRTKVS